MPLPDQEESPGHAWLATAQVGGELALRRLAGHAYHSVPWTSGSHLRHRGSFRGQRRWRQTLGVADRVSAQRGSRYVWPVAAVFGALVRGAAGAGHKQRALLRRRGRGQLERSRPVVADDDPAWHARVDRTGRGRKRPAGRGRCGNAGENRGWFVGPVSV